MRLRCGRCRRVLASDATGARTVARVDRERVAGSDAPLMARMGAAHELAAPRPPRFAGSVTVRDGVVTAACRCGWNRQWPLDELQALLADAGDGDTYLT